MMETPTQEQAQSEREQYVRAWNDTMIKIWQERITLLDVIDTSRLLHSPCTIPITADGRFVELTISQEFLEYGLWQDYGTGRETPRGNKGDIGRTKVRQRRPWFSKKYYSSVYCSVKMPSSRLKSFRVKRLSANLHLKLT